MNTPLPQGSNGVVLSQGFAEDILEGVDDAYQRIHHFKDFLINKISQLTWIILQTCELCFSYLRTEMESDEVRVKPLFFLTEGQEVHQSL